MGVDSYAVLIYGWEFSFSECKKLLLPFLQHIKLITEEELDQLEGDDYIFVDAWDKFESWVQKNHPSLRCGCTYPYYDCYPRDNVYYISLAHSDSDIKNLIMFPELPANPLINELRLKDPEIIALVNVI